jgi:hypothetical protein
MVNRQQEFQCRKVPAEMAGTTFVVHLQEPLSRGSDDILKFVRHWMVNPENLPSITATTIAYRLAGVVILSAARDDNRGRAVAADFAAASAITPL